jgi:antitoxin component of MazEF toxin-antitoxin module
MSQFLIVSVGNAAGIVLPPEVLESLGWCVGDLVDVSASDGRLILQPARDTVRRERTRR